MGRLATNLEQYAIAGDLLEKLLMYKDCVLTPREKRVLKMRSGFEDGRKYTLREIGRSFQLSQERVRQIESKALHKLCFQPDRAISGVTFAVMIETLHGSALVRTRNPKAKSGLLMT